ncbi:unnamed protein product [Peronospora belbahrii]|uniref:Exonuclease 1 n=1 Tax=Peronospora belbahrii TaxID=622444 RepID=A0AAU9KY56_9STRA|nr:unnamed protein product [Peronospora belbahrii]CAH0514792.1 unnamed protein product [Peronospora belbahrii]
MGIDGFLRQLSDVVDKTHLEQFTGQILVVDALSWLYKACYGCAFELSTGKDTDKYVHYMLRKVDMMYSCGVAKIILVFDGQRLPLKSSTQEKRQKYKEEHRNRALEAMTVSKQLHGSDRQDEVNKAFQLFQRSVSITPQIISTVMNALRAKGIPFVVAPFEADAQMVWMCKEGLAAGIVTEDSDVVVYCLTANVSCPVLVKLEDNGSAQAVSRSILYKNSAKYPSNALLRKIHFLTSGEKEATRTFVQACVLAGCDFIDSLPNVGFATAVKRIFNFRGAPSHLRVQRLVSKLSSSGTKVPSGFMQEFYKAETIFFHHIIFNPKKRSCELLIDEKHINCFPDILQRAKESLGITSQDLISDAQEDGLHALATATKSFLGGVLSREIVEKIYKGEVCARTLCINFDSPKTSLQQQECFDGSQSSAKALSASRELLGKCNGYSQKTDQGFSTVITRREVRQLSPIATAQQNESRKRSQANERAVSIRGLMSIYKTATVVTTPARYETSKGVRSTTQTLQTGPKHFNNGSNHSSTDASVPSTSILSTTVSEVKSSTVTSMSVKDLIAKHSQSIQEAKSPDDQEIFTKVASQSAPESRKRSQTATKPVASIGKKGRTFTDKPIPNGSCKTLFDFFQQR